MGWFTGSVGGSCLSGIYVILEVRKLAAHLFPAFLITRLPFNHSRYPMAEPWVNGRLCLLEHHPRGEVATPIETLVTDRRLAGQVACIPSRAETTVLHRPTYLEYDNGHLDGMV